MAVSEKKYVYDGMYVVVVEKQGYMAVVQPVDDHGNDYGSTFPAPIGDLMEAGEFVKE